MNLFRRSKVSKKESKIMKEELAQIFTEIKDQKKVRSVCVDH